MTTPEDTLRSLLKRHIDEPDLITNLGSFARRMTFMKAFAHYEVFKLVQDIPGDIVECGVYKGASLLSFARFLETFCTGDRTRKVLGFDHFKGLAERSEKDGFDERVGNTADGWNPATFRDTLFELVDAFNADSFVPKRPRVELVDGDVTVTAPAYVADNPGLRIALLHLDMDLYAPTLAALRAFWPRILTGGVVLLDEYAIREWPGESEALEEFFDGQVPRITKFPWASAPGGYFVKGG
ncbi:TylF/MycF/NovP-related O-methyltransferase [Zavarzinia sp. CC-PAN008]|uniref:TylF/MycF/NovP-related O-methyltransferase n=1 Tax=Zavarzinia sp. CC-PAN008 TaxID=3243332 RepID=UPI003F747B00